MVNLTKHSRLVIAKGAGADEANAPCHDSLLLWAGPCNLLPKKRWPGGSQLLCTPSENGGFSCYYQDNQGNRYDVPTRKEDHGYRLRLPSWSLEMFVGMVAWHETLHLPSLASGVAPHFIYLPMCGWYDDKWYDGPLFHQVQHDAATCSIVPIGGAVRLTVAADLASWSPAEGGAAASTDASVGYAFDGRGSLVTALRYHAVNIDKLNGLAITIKNYDVIDALGLVLCRLAFGSCYLCLYDAKMPAGQRRYWRRLCQNLGIDFGSSHKKLTPHGKIADTVFRNLFDQLPSLRILELIEVAKSVIPEGLWHT